MANNYSRKAKIEKKRHTRSAVVYGFLTIASIALLFFYGLPAIVKFSAFLGDVKESSEPVESTDSTPPAPPTVDSLPEFTNKTSVEISGSSEPGSTVFIYLNNKETEIVVNKGGSFSKKLSLVNGDNIVYLLTKDSSGNESQETEKFTVTFDDISPELEITNPTNGTQYYGSRQRQVVIEGTTEEDSDVTINDRFVAVEEDGSFAFATTLNEGDNSFIIKSTDDADNSTEKELNLNYSL